MLSLGRRHHRATLVIGVALSCLLLLPLIDALLAIPLRNWAERVMNSELKGYSVRIGWARPQVWKLAFGLEDILLIQKTHPDPPVANVGALRFSMQWRELLHLRVGGNLTIERPALHINSAQIAEEAGSQISLKERGWQDAVEAIYPIKLNRVEVLEGSLVYLSGGTETKPIQLTQVSLVAQNVRNIAADKDTFPSPVSLEGVLFDQGRIRFLGATDFLREPHAAARGELKLDHVPLDRLDPLAQDYQLKTTGGFLSAMGALEYTPEAQSAHFREVLFEDLRVDFVTSKATKALEKEHGRQVVKLAKKVRNAPRLLLQVDTLKMARGQIGFVNQATLPPYRLFMSEVSLQLENLSNQADQGRSVFQVRGAFMGSGRTEVTGGFRPTASPAEFDLRLKLDDAKLPALNGFLRAYQDVDVADGLFSMYTEIAVKNGRIEGYVKPLIQNLKIYDRRKDQAKPLGKRVKLHVYQVLANLFKNHSSKEVATVIPISGSTGDPQTQTWEVVRKLFGNGLGRAILPGFLEKPKAPTNKPAEKRP